jgi:hypothetical protein
VVSVTFTAMVCYRIFHSAQYWTSITTLPNYATMYSNHTKLRVFSIFSQRKQKVEKESRKITFFYQYSMITPYHKLLSKARKSLQCVIIYFKVCLVD